MGGNNAHIARNEDFDQQTFRTHNDHDGTFHRHIRGDAVIQGVHAGTVFAWRDCAVRDCVDTTERAVSAYYVQPNVAPAPSAHDTRAKQAGEVDHAGTSGPAPDIIEHEDTQAHDRPAAGSLRRPSEAARCAMTEHRASSFSTATSPASGVLVMHPSDRQPRREIMTAPVVHIHEMMARLGIGPETAVLPGLSLRYATAVRRCKLCRSKTSCRDWLDYAPALVNFAPGFCVNAEILFE